MEDTHQGQKAEKGNYWYIWYTKPRAEKQVFKRLQLKGVEVYLPLHRELRQWSDRRKWVESPLFNGYIFTNNKVKEWDTVRYTEGIIGYVRFDGKAACLRDEQVQEIKLLLTEPEDLEIKEEGIEPGEFVEIIGGPLRGMTGEVVEYKGKKRFAVRIEQLGKVLLVDLPKVFAKRNEKV